MKTVLILGSSGSLGEQVFNFLIKLSEYRIVGLSGWKNHKLLEKQSNIAGCQFTSLRTRKRVEELINEKNYDIIVNCVSGIRGIKLTWLSLTQTKRIILGNKESLVIHGKELIELCQNQNILIEPLDSELTSLVALSKIIQPARKYMITASGGVLKNRKNDYSQIDILSHPNWNMGQQITIDSSTMVNKIYEWVAALTYFGINSSNLDVYICKTSEIHGGILVNNKWLIIKSKPTMYDYIKIIFNNYDEETINCIVEECCIEDGVHNLLEDMDQSIYRIFALKEKIIKKKENLLVLLVLSRTLGMLLIRNLINYDEMIKLLIDLIT